MIGQRAAFSAVFLAAACARELPPFGQIVLHVETDARVLPSPSVGGASGAPAPLFDRLRVEIFLPGEDAPCDECVRDFGATEDLFIDGRASMGFVPRPHASGARARARVTLHRQGGTAGPRPASSIVRVVGLPPVGEDGVVDVWVPLRVDEVGVPVGALDAPVPASTSALGLVPGTFDREVQRGCSKERGPGEACVSGGTYWMGAPLHPLEGVEHLVSVRPFFVDLHEVTVAELRAAALATASDPIRNAACHYTDAPSDREDLPANCVSHGLAERYCASRGKALLTEARFERVATGLADADYPWGRTLPSCTDAVYARDPKGSAAAYKACLSVASGAAKPGSAALDRVRLGDLEVVDLAGNVGEWMRDMYAEDDDACRAPGRLVDPVCDSARVARGHAVRGGSFADSVLSLRASTRVIGSTDDTGTPRVGFRCARDGD